MKLITSNNIKAIVLGLVLTVGMGYAAAATFNGPSCAPPDCNADAPVTVGGNDVGITPYSQIKTGILSLMHLITPDLTVTNSDGVTPVVVGQVLTATDSTGRVGWTTPASAASVSSGMKSFTTSGTWTVPTGAKYAKLTLVGAGGYTATNGAGGGQFITTGYDGKVLLKTVSLSGISTIGVTVGASGAVNGYGTFPGGDSRVVLNPGGQSFVTAGGFSSTVTSTGDLNFDGPYLTFGNATAGDYRTDVTGGLVLIEWY